jgi:cytochrome b involved in lipid metabolism
MDSNNIYTREEVINRNGETEKEFCVIVDNYVLDLTSFLQHHPAGAQKIIQRRKKSIDITSNFIDHFGHTVRTFRQACQEYDRDSSMGKTPVVVVLKFPEVAGEVLIIGKIR